MDDWILSGDLTKEALDSKLEKLIETFDEPMPLGHAPIIDYQNYQPPPEQEKLEDATTRGDIAAVKSVIQKWRAESENGQKSPGFFGTSMTPAIKGGHLTIAAYLVENVTTALQLPLNFQSAMDTESYEFMELFLHHGFDINKSWSEHYSTPLAHTFENEEMTRKFLDHGADPNAESRINNTPLSRAVQFAPMSIIKFLFDRGGPGCMNNGELFHCVTYRDLSDRIEVLEYLFTQGAQRDINKLIRQDRPNLFSKENLILGCDAPLHVATRTGKMDVVEFLIAHDADAQKPSGKGRLPIDVAGKADQDGVAQYLAPISVHQPRL